MTYHNPVGAKVGVTYKLYSGKTVLWVGQPLLRIQANEVVTIPVTFVPAKGKSYVMTVVVNDKSGFTESRTIALMPPTP
jgi:hypothetical protein